MAKKLNIKQNVYSLIESGQRKVSDEMLKQFADLLGVTVDLLNDPAPVVPLASTAQSVPGINTITENLPVKVIEELTHQLKVKDEQISSLLGLLQHGKPKALNQLLVLQLFQMFLFPSIKKKLFFLLSSIQSINWSKNNIFDRAGCLLP